MKESVRVRVHIEEYPHDWKLGSSMWESWILGKLKESGVPVVGTLKFTGIASGTLRRFDDPKDFGASFYEWTPDESKP